jgi:hypothetical protein
VRNHFRKNVIGEQCIPEETHFEIMLCSLSAWSYVKHESSIIVLFEHVGRICVPNLGHGKDGYVVAVLYHSLI